MNQKDHYELPNNIPPALIYVVGSDEVIDVHGDEDSIQRKIKDILNEQNDDNTIADIIVYRPETAHITIRTFETKPIKR